MPSILSKREISIPEEPLSGITQENIQKYLIWSLTKTELNSRLLKPFKESCIRKTGYSDENRPSKLENTKITISKDIQFNVETKLTTKKPPYANINSKFMDYIEFLNERHDTKKRPHDMLTIDNEPFINYQVLDSKLWKIYEEETEGRQGISQKLILRKHPFEVFPNNITMEFARDYSALTDFNARAYIISYGLLKLGKERIDVIGQELKSDALDTLVSEPEKVATISYPFDKISYIVQLEPRKAIKHAAVFNAFAKKAPVVLKTNSNFGDFGKIKLISDGYKDQLVEKGLIDKAFLDDYKPKKRDDAYFVSVSGVKKRFFNHNNTNVTSNIEMNISLMLV